MFKTGDIIVNKVTKDIYIYKNKINSILFSYYTRLSPNGKCVVVPDDGSTHCTPISNNLCKANKVEIESLNKALKSLGIRHFTYYKK